MCKGHYCITTCNYIYFTCAYSLAWHLHGKSWNLGWKAAKLVSIFSPQLLSRVSVFAFSFDTTLKCIDLYFTACVQRTIQPENSLVGLIFNYHYEFPLIRQQWNCPHTRLCVYMYSCMSPFFLQFSLCTFYLMILH